MRLVAVRKNRQKPLQAKPQCVISSTASARSNPCQRFVDQLMRRRVRGNLPSILSRPAP
jgi:hypothetical protein